MNKGPHPVIRGRAGRAADQIVEIGDQYVEREKSCRRRVRALFAQLCYDGDVRTRLDAAQDLAAPLGERKHAQVTGPSRVERREAFARYTEERVKQEAANARFRVACGLDSGKQRGHVKSAVKCAQQAVFKASDADTIVRSSSLLRRRATAAVSVKYMSRLCTADARSHSGI